MNTTESVDSLYPSEARGKALASAGNRFVSSTRFKSTLLDVRPLDVCRVLKEANCAIDVALEFDGRHAESRLLEVEADPDKPVPNPYCAENLESLITVVRTVLSSALEELRLSMPPDWEGSQLPDNRGRERIQIPAVECPAAKVAPVPISERRLPSHVFGTHEPHHCCVASAARRMGSKMSACRMKPRSLACDASVAPSESSP